MSASAIDHNLRMLAPCARNSELLQQHAAIIMRSGYRPVVVAMGYNHYAPCHYSIDKPSAHAEKVAISKFCHYYQARAASDAKIRRKLKKTSILVARINQDASHTQIHQFRNSAPCYHCNALLKSYGVRKVVFTTDGGEPQCQKGKSAR